MTRRQVVFAAAAWLFCGGIVFQVFLAGASLFGMTDWTLHIGLGWTLGSLPILLLLLAIIARSDRSTVLLTAGLAVAAILQPELAAARDDAPIVAAFHPVNALLVFWLAWSVARRSSRPDRQVAAGTS